MNTLTVSLINRRLLRFEFWRTFTLIHYAFNRSAFFWFCNDERTKVKALNPEYGVGDIAKELGKKWSDVDPSVKSKYEAMAENDKKRYERVSKPHFPPTSFLLSFFSPSVVHFFIVHIWLNVEYRFQFECALILPTFEITNALIWQSTLTAFV